jgi:predicted dehydrogenase
LGIVFVYTNMSETEKKQPLVTSRRDFLKTAGTVAATSALAGVVLPHVHAGESGTLQIALVGAGGRGTGAAGNALSTKKGPVTLSAIVDVFENRLENSYDTIKRKFGDLVDVPKDKRFIGFDGYKHAMDSLKRGDIVVLTTPLAFRWVHYKYAIEKGLHVFMEKPVTADGPTSRRMLDLAKEASAKGLKCGVGLMSRHARHLQELHKRVQDGAIGDVLLMRGYRMHGPVASAFSKKWPGKPSELLWQISRFHSFIWASGGCYSDFYIHHIDHLCWMKNGWPVKAHGLGGRHFKTDEKGEPWVDQNFDSYAVEYTFEDGAKFYMDGRCNSGAHPMYFSHVHGTKGMAIAARNGDYAGPSSIHTGQLPMRSNMTWQSKVEQSENDPYLNEWNDLMDAIRNDKPYNEVPFGVQASVVTSMGRMAAHTGQEVTYNEMLNHPVEYAPGIDKWTMDSPPPVKSDAEGKYPVPMPGFKKDREW